LRIAKINRYIRSDAEAFVVSELSSAIPGQRRHQPGRQLLYLPNESADNTLSVFTRYFDEHDEPGLTFHQRRDMAVLPPSQEITLPMPGDRPVLYLGWSLSDRYGVDDLSTRLSAGGGAFASAHQSSGSQM
jgi:hypothetical protein